MILLDTNVIAELRKGARANPHVRSWFASLDSDAIVLSVLTIDKVVNDSIAAYLMTNPAVNRQKKRCFEIVMQRSKLAADYVTRLKMLREAIQSTRETNVTPLSERLKSLEAD